MGQLLVAITALFFTASAAYADSRHYEAENCEFYVEKIHLQQNSYQSVSANLYIKVALPHLDAPVKEVGMRSQAHVQRGSSGVFSEEWRNTPAVKVNPFGDTDQWRLTLLMKAGELKTTYEGTFYLLTEAGTWYWLHPMNDGRQNFWITTDTFTIDNEVAWHEIWVNDHQRLRGFNPQRCQ